MSYEDTRNRLDALTDDTNFEKLATLLLSRTGLNLRPLGGSGDQGRDAVAGLYEAEGGEDLVVTVSLEKGWSGKVREDLARIKSHKYTPKNVIAVTNRRASPKTQADLQQEATKNFHTSLTVHDQRWLIARLYLRQNLDLRREFLNLPDPRPHFFLDLSEYEALLRNRHLLDAHFSGRKADMEELERLLATERKAVILEADGGYGKTRLAFELAASGMSLTPWYFVDPGFDFKIDYLAETEAGYDVTILIDDAHRRPDLEQILRALEQRTPTPRLVFTLRPGHASTVENALNGLALPSSVKLPLRALGRSEIVAFLAEEPFLIDREGMLSAILGLSGGNAGIAVLAGGLASAGTDPTELSRSEVFSKHVNSRLKGASMGSRADRELLALISALRSLDVSDPDDADAVKQLIGLEGPSLRRKLDELADAGILVEEAQSFALKPDIVSEHLLRQGFLPAAGRALLSYEKVYGLFAPRKRLAMLGAVGEARVDTTEHPERVLTIISRDVSQALEVASSVDDLVDVCALARALGAGGASIGLYAAERIINRLGELDDAAAETLGPPLVDILAAAKFGRDQFPRAWLLLLKLGSVLLARDTSAAREKIATEISGIFASAPMNYSRDDSQVLNYLQVIIGEQTEAWWEDEGRHGQAATAVGAMLVRSLWTLELEQHRQSAANAMAINIVAGSVPATPATAKLLELGASLFKSTFETLDPPAQLKQLDVLHRLSGVAGGYSGLLGRIPPEDLQEMAEDKLIGVEQWLADRVARLPLPVGAAVLDYLAGRRTRVGGKPARRKIALPRPVGALRQYIDLVDSNARPGSGRTSWQKQHDAAIHRGERYGKKLVKSKDPLGLLTTWSLWIDEWEKVTEKPANYVPLSVALGHVGKAAPSQARKLAEYVVENDLSILRFAGNLLRELAQDESCWGLIETWSRHPSAQVRVAAADAVVRAPDDIAKPVITQLAKDADHLSVRSAGWRLIVYQSDAKLSDWRLDLALDLTARGADPLALLDQVLGRLRHQAQEEGTTIQLLTTQREAVRRIVLASAREEPNPNNQSLRVALEELEQIGLDLVLPWVAARLKFVLDAGTGRFVHPLPDEIQPLVHARRNSANGRRELTRLLDEIEKPTSTGLYRHGLEQAIAWLGSDSETLTRRIASWARGGEREVRLAHAFANCGNWRTFTKRAKLLLDALPNNAELRDWLIGSRHPLSFIGSKEPYYRARANDYRRWTRSRDERLRRLGADAAALYEEQADAAVEQERREQDAF